MFSDYKDCATNPNCLLGIVEPKKPFSFPTFIQTEKKDDHIIRDKRIKLMGLQVSNLLKNSHFDCSNSIEFRSNMLHE